MFMTFLGQMAPEFAALPSEAEFDEDNRRSALDRNPGLDSFLSCPAWTRTDWRRGTVCVTTTFFSSFFFSSFPALGSGFSFLSKGFANSTPGLACVGVVGLDCASRLALRGVDAGLDENLELKLLIHEPRRPPAPALLLMSFKGPFVPVPPVVVPSPLRRLVKPGRLVCPLEGSDKGVGVAAGETLGAAAVVVLVAIFGSVTSEVVAMNAGFSVVGVVGVGGTTATGGGVAGTAGWFCSVEGGFSTGFLSAGVLCFRRSNVLNQMSLAQSAHTCV
jgi:hypothetical protein